MMVEAGALSRRLDELGVVSLDEKHVNFDDDGTSIRVFVAYLSAPEQAAERGDIQLVRSGALKDWIQGPAHPTE